jgi:hypothetical protein
MKGEKKMPKQLQIPEKFKEKIMERFDPKNAYYDEHEGTYRIDIVCILCHKYSCSTCPANPCMEWLSNRASLPFTLDGDMIEWDESDDKEARQSLNTLIQYFESDVVWFKTFN